MLLHFMYPEFGVEAGSVFIYKELHFSLAIAIGEDFAKRLFGFYLISFLYIHISEIVINSDVVTVSHLHYFVTSWYRLYG